MNTLERKVSEALRGYGEGLDMTTQDIDRLEQELEVRDETHRKERRGRIWQAAVAACAVTGVVLGALALRSDPEPRPVPASPAPLSLSQLAGIWANVGHGPGSMWLWYFTEDGRLTQLGSAEEMAIVGGDVSDWTVRPAPGGFTMDRGNGSSRCHFDATASITASGRMQARLTTTTPACPEAGVATDWVFIRLTPVSAEGASIVTGLPTSDPKRLDATDELYGTWLVQGTGKLVLVTYEGYRVVDLGDPAASVTGKVLHPKNGSFVLTSDTGPDCSTVYSSGITRGSTVDFELAENSCGRLNASSDTWVKLN
ncbi:hypothetical protein [Intrasporangium sp. DVR]|uniref:hypothetical protein n=1 Tax=Intrasporangium sp. DVR TaxID=3127867 RepID=UPI00313A65A7